MWYVLIIYLFSVLCIGIQALKKLRHSGLKPYVVFVASPRFERLQATRKVGPEKAKKRSSSQHLEPDGGQVYTVSVPM